MLPSDHREHRNNVRVVGKKKIADEGAGQIIVESGTAYIGHLEHEGTTLVDVSNPSDPKVLSKVAPPLKSHAHKVQVVGDIMIVNNEQYKNREPWKAGVRIFDVSDKEQPKELSFYETAGKGGHRMWFVDGQYAHVTLSAEGFTNQIYVILDVSEPTKPHEVSRFWMEGMWEAGNETPQWREGLRVRAHGPPYHVGNRVYLGWTDGGFTILDVTDMKKPSLISHVNWCPPFGGLTHTVLPLLERDLLVVTDEAHEPHCDEPEKFAWLVDVKDETNPVPIATVQVQDEGFCEKGGRFGPHNVHENRPGALYDDQLIYVTYFSGGLRIIDIQDRYRPKEVGWFIPERPAGQEAIQTNDVFVEANGLIYIVDRLDGTLYVLEYTGPR